MAYTKYPVYFFSSIITNKENELKIINTVDVFNIESICKWIGCQT